MELIEHEKSALAKFGKPWTKVHVFLDQYFRDFGASHRPILHHQRGVALVVERFGAEARAVAEQHIQEDLHDPEGEPPRDWLWYGEPVMLQLHDYDRFEAVIRGLYPDGK